MQVLLSDHKIWFSDIFKTSVKIISVGIYVMSSVSRETVSRVHEEKGWGASGNSVV